MKQELLRDIRKEMRIAAGAQKLYLVTKDRQTKAQVKELRNISERKVKALFSSLHKLNEQLAQREAENSPDAVLETTRDTDVNFPAPEITEPEVQVISDPAIDSSQHQHEESSEEPVPETEQLPEEPSDRDLPVEDTNEEAGEEAESVVEEDPVQQQQQNEEER
ncbi:phosphatidylglycerol--prolipoprotein diacylglyceryl transferase-like [Xenopus laevis]|uniref:Phosphatidylglycerol--prolipoprotein diacylglyceryl transferase-like n=1 Tax=Xenopus laevis TaxID=8355 RepID=A0A8J1MJB5_XENLA|nr:phosphatidylglycerol--prolipoprotein diacylglyceryl transferase-like [Xenopus laevis]